MYIIFFVFDCIFNICKNTIVFFSKKTWILCFLFNIIFLQSCTMITSTGIIISGYTIARDKTVSEATSDLQIFLSAKNKLLSSDYSSTAFSVDLKIHNGGVYIIGRVRDNNTRLFIVDQIKKINGVKKIYDEIIVDNNTSGMKSIMIAIKDAFVTIQVKMSLAFTSNIRSVNYSIETFNGIVYVIGNATNMVEAEKTSMIISKNPGVKRIVNYSVVSR